MLCLFSPLSHTEWKTWPTTQQGWNSSSWHSQTPESCRFYMAFCFAYLPGDSYGESSHYCPDHSGSVSSHPHVLIPEELITFWCLPPFHHTSKIYPELFIPQKHHFIIRLHITGVAGDPLCWIWAFPSNCHVLWPLCGHLSPTALWCHHEQESLCEHDSCILVSWEYLWSLILSQHFLFIFLWLQKSSSVFLWCVLPTEDLLLKVSCHHWY